jgi:hypothetical protein
MKTTRILLVIAVLQALTLFTLWKGDVIATPAKAAVPDSGVGDLKNVVSELKGTNDKLDAILKYMESGKLQVQVSAPEKNK